MQNGHDVLKVRFSVFLSLAKLQEIKITLEMDTAAIWNVLRQDNSTDHDKRSDLDHTDSKLSFLPRVPFYITFEPQPRHLSFYYHRRETLHISFWTVD